MMHAAEPELAPREPVRFGIPERASPDFEAVYREHFRFVWRSARRLGVHPSFIDDVVQETFLVVHRRLDDFEGRSTTKTWLYGIVRRVVSDQRRTQRRRPLEGGTDMESMTDTAHARPDASAEQAEQVRLFYALLDQLDDDKREVFVLADLEGMTMAEIAESIGVNANTVSSRLRAARQKFEEAVVAHEARGQGSAK